MQYDEFLRRKVVLAEQSGFDVTDADIHPMLKPHQRAIVRWAVAGGRRAICAAFGLGKCHGMGTPILMADGAIKPVEQVAVGDRLMGDDGTPRTVLSLARGREQMYRVTLRNGDSYTCNESHIFSLKVSNRHAGIRSGTVVDMSLREWQSLPGFAKRNCYKHYKVAVDFEPRPVAFDPYLYGAWLGDGTIGSLGWTINDVDDEIVERIHMFAASEGLHLRVASQQGCTYYAVTRHPDRRGRAPMPAAHGVIKSSVIDGEKRIDPQYLRNSREVRLALLAGIVDTDGHLIDGCYEVATKWKGLRDDLLFLCRSLGLSVSFRPKVVNSRTYWRLFISGHTHDVPCLTRKRAAPRRQIKDPSVYGFTVEPLGEGDYFGFAIDGNHRYLLGDFTVTHNTLMQIECVRLTRERAGGMGLIVIPLGVRQEFVRDAAMLGLTVTFIRRIEDAADPSGIYLTNYESIRDEKLDPRLFSVVSLDEASALRGFGGTKTFRQFMALFAGDAKTMDRRTRGTSIRYRFVATATPSPNEYIELLAYSAFLGVMDVSAAKTRFFKRNSEKADSLTIHPHKIQEFWLWVSSWALFVQRPSDLGFSDDGYELPPVDVRWHEIPADHADAGMRADGQINLFKEQAIGVVEASREKRASLDARIAKMLALRAEDPRAHRILWHDLEDERRAIERAIPGVTSVYGSQDLDERESAVIAFSNGEIAELASKPVLLGSGCNLQRHCAWAIFLGIGFKFNDFIQAIHRIQRFLQPRPVRIDLIYTESEREVRRQLERKWRQHEEMTNTMSELIREYGLSNAAMAESMTRAMGVERVEIRGERYRIVNEDCVRETARMPADSVGLVLTSIPFSTQYEYSPNFADFGHTDTNTHFFAQMDFLTPELLRVLQPGRLAAIHVKDRIVPGGMTGLGFQTVYPFHARCIEHYTRHGFAYMGMKTIVTDVVRENNQTYRLGWTEQCKDGSKMGVGMPEYLLIFRKSPTSNEKSYADLRVVKDKATYTRARWQVDAHGFARSSGNRLLTPQELEGLPHDVIFKLFRDHSLANVYDFEHDVRIGETLEAKGSLPSDFMLLQPQSWHPDVWSDITRMLTLNGAQSAKGREMHLCLARGTLVLTRERGYIPIETVQPGEQTLTHKGRWRRVLVARQTGTRPTIALRAQGVPRLTLTPDHKVWARVTDWARERDGAERTAPAWVPAEAVLGGYVNFKLPEEEPALDDDRHWWIVGRWLADGHWDARGGAIISCGRHERDALLSALGDHAGAMFDTGTALQVRIIDGKLIRDTLANCGEGAAGKHLPPQAAVLPQKQARALLEGYLSGDGHFLESRSRWQATSTSRALALGVALLVQRVHGTIASVHRGREERDSTIQGRPVRCRQEWVISFDSTTDGRKRPFVLEDGAWKKVRSLTDAGDEEVWCLRVEEDESFTAEGCIVKNCPLQFDLADRAIAQWSMPGETVYDPFGGLMTVPYRAILQKRFGIGVELSHRYFLDGAAYCAAAEREVSMPSLFDTLEPVAA